MADEPTFIELLHVATGAKRKARRGTTDAILRDGECFANPPLFIQDAASAGGESGGVPMLPFGHSGKIERIQAAVESGDRARVLQGQADASALAASFGTHADNPNATPEEREAFKKASAFLTGLAVSSRMRDAGTRDAALAPGQTDADRAHAEMVERYRTAHLRR